MIGVWFFDVGSVAAVQTGGGIAYVAHVGGFLFGAVTRDGANSEKSLGLIGNGSGRNLP